jgi:hypothetical protein
VEEGTPAATLGDLLVVLVLAHRKELNEALARVLEGSERAAKVIDAVQGPTLRTSVVKRTGIDATNIAKVTGPLLRGGWIVQAGSKASIEYRRSAILDLVLQGEKVSKWSATHAKSAGMA